MGQSRQAHLDSLRGIAALIVVSLHYFAAFYPHAVFGALGNYQQHTPWESLFFFPPFGLFVSGTFAVCLFFILSGYVLSYGHLGKTHSVPKVVACVVKRPIRLGGLVWMSVIIGAVFWYFGLFANGPVADLSGSKPWFGKYWAKEFDVCTFLVDMATSSFYKGGVYNPPLWTIKIELYGSMMVYFFLFLFGRFRYRLFISVLLVLVFKNSFFQGFWIGLTIADIVKNHDVKTPFKSNTPFHWVLFVLFLFLSSYPDYAGQAFITHTIYGFLPDDKGFGGGYPMLSAFLIFVLAISSNRVKGYLTRPVLLFLGHISYGLYVIHFLVIGSFSSWVFLVSRQRFDYHASFFIALFSGLPIIIVLAYAATRYVDGPAVRLANHAGEKAIGLAASLPLDMIYARTLKLLSKRFP